MKQIIYCLTAILLLFNCKTKHSKNEISKQIDTCVILSSFNRVVDGKDVNIYTLHNKSGMEIKLTNFGARIISLMAPGKDSKYADINLGFATLDEYLADKSFAGSIVGRYANRIAKGKFSIEGKEYSLAINNEPNSLHGGLKGFDKVVWDVNEANDTSVLFTYVSADMEEGYPGKLKVTVKYSLSYNNEMIINYEAVADKKTVINLSNHAYFNMAGGASDDILGQELQINAVAITPVDSTLIPTGEILPIKDTPFDFDSLTPIGKNINNNNIQLKYGMGFDHNFALKAGEGLKFAVKFKDIASGRTMEIWTTEPAIQFYSGNFLNSTIKNKQGKLIKYRSYIVLEPQHYPNSPNTTSFPSTIIEPGKTYRQTSVYKFYAE